MNRTRGKITYANVVSTLALFLVLAGGTAFAAKEMLPKNSVGAKQLKKEAVTGAKIKNGAITGPKIAAGTISGSNINVGTLGTVPSASKAAQAENATNATNAQALQGQSAAQIAAGAKLKCPTGTTFVVGTCIENTARPAAEFLKAGETCAKAGRLLPSVTEMENYDRAVGTTATPEWAGQIYYDSVTFRAMYVYGVAEVGAPKITEAQTFRCSIPPSN